MLHSILSQYPQPLHILAVGDQARVVDEVFVWS